MNDKLKIIAEYDGWVIKGEPDFTAPYKIFVKEFPSYDKMIPYISPTGNEYDGWEKELKYLTSLDWLHPVAMNVLDKLTELFNDTLDGDVFVPVSDLEYNIKRSCYIRPINGEYIDLFNATVEGIIYLKNHSK